jgi:hypothetical protein
MTDDEKMDALLRQMAAEEYNRPPQIVPREQMWDAVMEGLSTGKAGTGKREPGTDGARELPFVRRVPRWVYLAVAAVLLLAVGIQVGRRLGPSDQIAQVQRDSLGNVVPDSVRGTPRNDVTPSGKPDEQVVLVPRSDDGTKGGRPTRPKEPERFTPSSPDDAAARAYTVAAAQHLTAAEAMLTAFKGDLSQGRMDAEMASWGKELLSNTRLLLDSPAARDPVRRKLLQDLELVLVQIVQLSPGASARDRDLIKGALTDDQVLTRLRTAVPNQKGT